MVRKSQTRQESSNTLEPVQQQQQPQQQQQERDSDDEAFAVTTTTTTKTAPHNCRQNNNNDNDNNDMKKKENVTEAMDLEVASESSSTISRNLSLWLERLEQEAAAARDDLAGWLSRLEHGKKSKNKTKKKKNNNPSQIAVGFQQGDDDEDADDDANSDDANSDDDSGSDLSTWVARLEAQAAAARQDAGVSERQQPSPPLHSFSLSSASPSSSCCRSNSTSSRCSSSSSMHENSKSKSQSSTPKRRNNNNSKMDAIAADSLLQLQEQLESASPVTQRVDCDFEAEDSATVETSALLALADHVLQNNHRAPTTTCNSIQDQNSDDQDCEIQRIAEKGEVEENEDHWREENDEKILSPLSRLNVSTISSIDDDSSISMLIGRNMHIQKSPLVAVISTDEQDQHEDCLGTPVTPVRTISVLNANASRQYQLVQNHLKCDMVPTVSEEEEKGQVELASECCSDSTRYYSVPTAETMLPHNSNSNFPFSIGNREDRTGTDSLHVAARASPENAVGYYRGLFRVTAENVPHLCGATVRHGKICVERCCSDPDHATRRQNDRESLVEQLKPNHLYVIASTCPSQVHVAPVLDVTKLSLEFVESLTSCHYPYHEWAKKFAVVELLYARLVQESGREGILEKPVVTETMMREQEYPTYKIPPTPIPLQKQPTLFKSVFRNAELDLPDTEAETPRNSSNRTGGLQAPSHWQQQPLSPLTPHSLSRTEALPLTDPAFMYTHNGSLSNDMRRNSSLITMEGFESNDPMSPFIPLIDRASPQERAAWLSQGIPVSLIQHLQQLECAVHATAERLPALHRDLAGLNDMLEDSLELLESRVRVLEQGTGRSSSRSVDTTTIVTTEEDGTFTPTAAPAMTPRFFSNRTPMFPLGAAGSRGLTYMERAVSNSNLPTDSRMLQVDTEPAPGTATSVDQVLADILSKVDLLLSLQQQNHAPITKTKVQQQERQLARRIDRLGATLRDVQDRLCHAQKSLSDFQPSRSLPLFDSYDEDASATGDCRKTDESHTTTLDPSGSMKLVAMRAFRVSFWMVLSGGAFVCTHIQTSVSPALPTIFSSDPALFCGTTLAAYTRYVITANVVCPVGKQGPSLSTNTVLDFNGHIIQSTSKHGVTDSHCL